MPKTRNRFLLWLPSGLLALGAIAVAADWWICLPAGLEASYVGRDTCARCHAEQLQQWTGSDHDRAMDLATPQTVLGDFDNQQFTYQGVTSTMTRRGDRFYVTTDGPAGDLETFPVKYTFGVRPLQQYLVEFDDGRVQCLSIAWGTERKRWFHLYPGEQIDHNDVLHWTKPAQNWNYMCAECHSTGLEKNYDFKTGTYHTTFAEIDVSCESCHGPGSIHVQLADSSTLLWDRRYGTGLADLKEATSKTELDTCAKCHSRRRIVFPGFKPGDEFLDYYAPELLDEGLYYADGQIQDEVYVYGSFLQSRMYREGVRCTDCHDPHTTRLLAQGNNLCNRCHTPAKYDTPAHHHHPSGTKGTQCVECHMPQRTYMVVDPRRDHSFRVPRPDLTVALGTPNACSGCHDDKDAQWAADRIDDWFGPRLRRTPHYSHALAAARKGKPGAQRLLRAVVQRPSAGPIARATAAALLGRYRSSESFGAIEEALADDEPLVRAAVMRNLDGTPPDLLARWLAPLLSDRVRFVRTEAARLLSAVPSAQLTAVQRDTFSQALDEFHRGQLATADQPASHLNLGVVYGNLGRPDDAEAAYRDALRIDPNYVPARFNLAMLYNGHGKNAEAEKLLKEVIALVPEMADAHYSLGLLLAEDDARLAEAADALGKAAALEPQRGRIHYNYGLALQKTGRHSEAESALRTACKLEPASAEFLYALALLYMQREQWSAALQCADRLRILEPNDPQWAAFWAEVKQRAD